MESSRFSIDDAWQLSSPSVAKLSKPMGNSTAVSPRGRKIYDGRRSRPPSYAHGLATHDQTDEEVYSSSDEDQVPSQNRRQVKPKRSSRSAGKARRRPAEFPSGYAIYSSDESSSEDDEEIFCICRKPEYGMMIECEECKEYFHAGCVNIERGMVWEENPFFCPRCENRTGRKTHRRPKCQEPGCPRPSWRIGEDLCIQHYFPLHEEQSLPPSRERNAETTAAITRTVHPSTALSKQTITTITSIDADQLTQDKINWSRAEESKQHDLRQLAQDLAHAERTGQRWRSGQAREEADSWSPSVLRALRAPISIETTASSMKMHTVVQPPGTISAHYTISRDATWCHVDLAADANDSDRTQDLESETGDDTSFALDLDRDYYADLELDSDAEPSLIRKQFKELGRKYHPDRNLGAEESVIGKFQALQAAHEVLGNASTRKRYDVARHRR